MLTNLGIGLGIGSQAVPAILGPELVVNGGFDADTNWSKGTGWTISGGLATQSGSASLLTNTGQVVAGKTYKVIFDVVGVTAGNVRARLGSQLGTAYFTDGTYEQDILANGTALVMQSGTGFVGSVDNVSVREIL